MMRSYVPNTDPNLNSPDALANMLAWVTAVTQNYPRPGQGWTAFFVELTFPGPGNLPLVFTTEVVVAPDVYPFPAPPGPG
jgi:hypothetical protein